MLKPNQNFRFSRWRHEILLALLIIGLLVAASLIDPRFVKWKTQLKLAENIWEPAILALGMTLIILTAGIDLSIGSAMALAAVVFGMVVKGGASPWAAAAFAVLTGFGCGAVNGYLVSRIRVHPLLVTLATLAAFRGIAEGLSKGAPVSLVPEETSLSQATLDSFASINGKIAGLPIPGLIFGILAAAYAVYLSRTPGGKFLYAIGHNETAARFSGVPVQRLQFQLYAGMGLLAGLVAVLYSARRSTATPEAGLNYELDVITAVVVGGTSIFGGRGHIVGTCLGVLLIHETRQFVQWHWESDELNLVVIGSLLIVSVLLHRILSRSSTSD